MTDALRLEGKRIALRPLCADDAAELFSLARDPAVTRYLTWDKPDSQADTEAFIAEAARRMTEEPGSCHHFGIALLGGDEPIGATSLDPVVALHRRATIGSWIGRPHWGKGFMREAKALILDYAFGPLGLERVQAFVDLDNQRSLSSLEACCFRREGIARRMVRHGDHFASQVMMAVLAGEHEALVRSELGREPTPRPAAEGHSS